MNKTVVQIHLDAFGHKCRSGKLRPFIGMMPVVMADDDAPRAGVVDIFQDIRAQTLVGHV